MGVPRACVGFIWKSSVMSAKGYLARPVPLKHHVGRLSLLLRLKLECPEMVFRGPVRLLS